MLSESQIAQYHSDGFVVPDYRVPPDMLADLAEAHERLIAKHPEFSDLCTALLDYDLSFLNVTRNEELLDMVEQVIGPDFALWNSSMFAKPAHVGSRTPWHQDGEYWPIRPLATCTVWIALDASTQENGCLRVLPGSHKARKLFKHKTSDAEGLSLNQELSDPDCPIKDPVDIMLEPGQVSLHDVYLAHGSEPNRSGKSRRGMTLRFMPTTSVFDRARAEQLHHDIGIRNHAVRTLFLMRGGDPSGENDFRLRR